MGIITKSLVLFLSFFCTQRSFVCQEPGCGKSFIRRYHLKRHSVTHLSEKPEFRYKNDCIYSQVHHKSCDDHDN